MQAMGVIEAERKDRTEEEEDEDEEETGGRNGQQRAKERNDERFTDAATASSDMSFPLFPTPVE